MLTYQQLDLIADSYIPVLMLISFFLLGKDRFGSGTNKQHPIAGAVFKSAIIIYAIKGLNNSFHLWALADSNYSTHTALALVFVIFLASKGITSALLSLCSMLLYAALMVYQEYHSIADIVTTTLVVAPIVFIIQRKALKNGHG